MGAVDHGGRRCGIRPLSSPCPATSVGAAVNPRARKSCNTVREPFESTRMEAETRGVDKPVEVARTLFATDAGEFELRAFEYPSGYVYVVLVKGELGDG